MNYFEEPFKRIISPVRHPIPVKSSIEARKCTDFSLKSYDNLELKGEYFLIDKDFPWIVYSHSLGSNRSEGRSLVPLSEHKKFNLCLYDSRASGLSQGENITFGQREKNDLLFILVFLNRTLFMRKVMLWGRSIGCNCVLQLIYAIFTHEPSSLKSRGMSINFLAKECLIKNQTRTINDDIEDKNNYIRTLMFSFISRNPKYITPSGSSSFTVICIILDSPYQSISTFVSDNIKNYSYGVQLIVGKLLLELFQDFCVKKFKVDPSAQQNEVLVPVIDLATLFIYSSDDNLIPKSRFLSLINKFSSKKKKSRALSLEIEEGHSQRRSSGTSEKIFTAIQSLMDNSSVFEVRIAHFEKHHSSQSKTFIKTFNSSNTLRSKTPSTQPLTITNQSRPPNKGHLSPIPIQDEPQYIKTYNKIIPQSLKKPKSLFK